MIAHALFLALATAALSAVAAGDATTVARTPPTATVPAAAAGRADFGAATPSLETRDNADWVVASDDARGLPFLVIDKREAQVFAFNARGRLLGAVPALLGLAVGDESVPGIGDRPLATIKPAERTTPSGRFVAALDRNLKGQEILWIDYDAGIALHRIITGVVADHRARRLATPSPADNRITFGCINVPVAFFDDVVTPAFAPAGGIVYVLPETRAVHVFIAADGSRQRKF